MRKVEQLATIYGGHLDEMADLITDEMGSPRSFSRLGQAAAAVSMIHLSLAVARDFPWTERRHGVLGEVHLHRAPVGVVGGDRAMERAAVLDHAQADTRVDRRLPGHSQTRTRNTFRRFVVGRDDRAAGTCPKGWCPFFPAVPMSARRWCAIPVWTRSSFTGSSAVGRRIATLCGEQLKRVSLELGGKSAAIILDDADIGKTVKELKSASLMNNGQACVAQTRILVSERRRDEVVDALADMMSGLQVGDPTDEATDVGPLVAQRQQARVQDYIRSGVKEGARMVLGGEDAPHDRGWYVRPTLFADVTNDMRIAREEIFGPVLSVLTYRDEPDAVRIANDSDYGLAGSVWTADIAHGLEVAASVRAGTYGINMYTLDIGSPFGGFKQSGIGREFGPEGLHEYVELQSVISKGTMPPLSE